MSGKFFSNVLLSCLATLAISAPPAVQAQETQPAPSPQGQPDPLDIYRQVGAGPDQLKTISGLGKEFDQAQKVRGKLLKNLIEQMREISLQVDPDEKAAVAKQEEINKVVAEMATDRIKLMLKIRGTLNPDQKRMLVDRMQERMKPQARQPNGAPN